MIRTSGHAAHDGRPIVFFIVGKSFVRGPVILVRIGATLADRLVGHGIEIGFGSWQNVIDLKVAEIKIVKRYAVAGIKADSRLFLPQFVFLDA